MLLDIHSHYAAPIAGESIWNVEPAVFSPIEGVIILWAFIRGRQERCAKKSGGCCVKRRSIRLCWLSVRQVLIN